MSYRKQEGSIRHDVEIRELSNNASANNIAFVTLAEHNMVDEVTAAEHVDMFLEWESGVAYKDSNIRKYNNELYKCLQDHTSQDDWTPDVSASLWKKIGDPTVDYPEWSQPISAGDAYMKGDKVSHNDYKWVSDIDNNVWEPSVYGWSEVNE